MTLAGGVLTWETDPVGVDPFANCIEVSSQFNFRFDADTRVVDLGCGGCGILLALERGRLIGVDPLMERYLQKFPFLAERSDIRHSSFFNHQSTF